MLSVSFSVCFCACNVLLTSAKRSYVLLLRIFLLSISFSALFHSFIILLTSARCSYVLLLRFFFAIYLFFSTFPFFYHLTDVGKMIPVLTILLMSIKWYVSTILLTSAKWNTLPSIAFLIIMFIYIFSILIPTLLYFLLKLLFHVVLIALRLFLCLLSVRANRHFPINTLRLLRPFQIHLVRDFRQCLAPIR